ncbi:MAG: Co2+/Mg2+ efflux protein ApaG [Saprospiraceae bacterium]|nr:Co2+/Mg2+ efflux protein ApaG [Saprospiraceae bacterium]MDW8483596.1 Co2+/Mg2+ efflux protein ApaG [Saprospiraceae bacterium]
MKALTTAGITVRAEAFYLPEHSKPQENRYLFGYRIAIENGSKHTVQLISRRWLIRNALGMRREVEGLGVVGQQPILAPGYAFEYSSYCDLDTDIGAMVGIYFMKRIDDGAWFTVQIPQFMLVVPARLN